MGAADEHHSYRLASGVVRSLRRRCPVCASTSISKHVASVERTCPECGLDLERQVGSFIGGIGLNTITAFGALIVMLSAGFIATGGEASITRVLIPTLVVAGSLPVVLYARSRLMWVALELRWWPLQPGEVRRTSSPLDTSS